MSTGTDSSSAHLVLIEDNPGDVWLFRYALDATRESYDLNVLDDGDRALDYVHQHWTSLPSAEPCLIILDLNLPKTDGMEILQKLRQAPALAHIKVAVVTGSLTGGGG
jgi:CheY-like chemotaxis protein